MDSELRQHAAKVEQLLPKILRIIYRSTEESTFAELPLAQFRILRVLHAGPRTITSIGDELGLTASAVTQMANRLQDAGMIERFEDLDDRRVKHLCLSSRALKMMSARQERRVGRMERVLEHIPQERRADIVTSLEALLRAGGEIPSAEPSDYVADLEMAIPANQPYYP
jgi:DNA-binding MarR family transcriptional regulator